MRASIARKTYPINMPERWLLLPLKVGQLKKHGVTRMLLPRKEAIPIGVIITKWHTGQISATVFLLGDSLKKQHLNFLKILNNLESNAEYKGYGS